MVPQETEHDLTIVSLATFKPRSEQQIVVIYIQSNAVVVCPVPVGLVCQQDQRARIRTVLARLHVAHADKVEATSLPFARAAIRKQAFECDVGTVANLACLR